MANPLQHAQKSLEMTEKEVKTLLPELFPRLALNYGLPVFLAVLLSTFAVPLLVNWIAPSTATILGYGANLLLFYFGWRFFEKRNKATSLYILYTRYSRQRRELQALIAQAQANSLANMDSLYTSVDIFEEAARNFISAATEAGLKPRQGS